MHRSRQPLIFLFLTLWGASTLIRALEDVTAGAEVHEDNGQVTINDDPTSNTTETSLPITATIFTGVPGPFHCRGSVLLQLEIPPPSADGAATAAQCFNIPRPVGCGTFVASKDDGCEARLFTEPDCRLYTNTAVFIPEERAVGGLWRSMSIQCGIPPPDPATLGSPPLQDLLKNAKKRPKTEGMR